MDALGFGCPRLMGSQDWEGERCRSCFSGKCAVRRVINDSRYIGVKFTPSQPMTHQYSHILDATPCVSR